MAAQAPTERGGLASIVARLARLLESDSFPTGERARLKRLRPTAPPPLSFYRFALKHLPEDWDRHLERQRDWITIVAGMAIMSPFIHDPQSPLGTVLGQERYSEARLERLLAAEGDVMRTLALRVCRFLAAKHRAFNWLDLAWLLLSRGDPRRQAQERIARDYYRQIELSDIQEKAQ